MKCIQKKYLLLLGCIATLALQGMETPNASLNPANMVTQETAQKPLAKKAATLQKQLTYLVDCGYVEQIKQIFATLPDNLKEHKQDLVHNLISHAEKLKAKKTVQVEQLKNRRIPRVHSWTSAIEGAVETILAGISAANAYNSLKKIYYNYYLKTKSSYDVVEQKIYPYDEVVVVKQKIYPTVSNSIVLSGMCYFFTKYAISHFKKALTYRHELEKKVVVLDAIINYLKNEIA